jgi:methanol dehydrogenase (cytochrome c) subunit 2
MISRSFNSLAAACGLAAVLSFGASLAALAYDGQHCKEPGVCWEPQPGMPEQLAGSKYDVRPLEDPKEVAKQGDSEQAMEERNAKRVENFKKTGKFIYEINQLPK